VIGRAPRGAPAPACAEAAPPRRRTLVVANPTAGSYRAGALEAVAGRLAETGVPVEVRLTQRAGEIAETCGALDPEVGTLVVAGGDGSINEAIAGFERLAEPPALAVVPFGTANVLAHELGLPRDPTAIADMIRRGRSAFLHYGLANGCPFVLMVSAGYDAAVVHSVPYAAKRRLGKLAYAITALKLTLAPRLSDVVVDLGAETLTCRLAVATNVSRYGGPFVVCPDESALKPGLHLIALMRDDPLAILRFGFALVTGRIARARDVLVRPITSARFESATPVPCQIDGDTFGTTPVTIERATRRVRIVVP
jgi:diacylglycerol kinase (ATP)